MSAPNGKKSEPRLDVDRTREKLARLGLEHVAALLEDKLTAAARDEIPPYRFLDQLLDDELGSREERRIRTSLRLSGIPTGATLANFDFSFPARDRARPHRDARDLRLDPREADAPDPGSAGRREDAPRLRAQRARGRVRLQRRLPPRS